MGIIKRQYDTIDGRIIGFQTSGVQKDFLTDALGSVTAEVDQSCTKTFEGRYKPYGGDLSVTGVRGKYGWVGTWGYRETGLSGSSHYVRARHYSKTSGSWPSVDNFWPSEPGYGYVSGRTLIFTDPSGLDAGYPCYPKRRDPWSGLDDFVGDRNGPSDFFCMYIQVQIAYAAGRAFCEKIGKKDNDLCLNDGPGSAIRHCVGGCLGARRCGRKIATWVLNDHEHMDNPVGSYDYIDTCLDLYNGSVGLNLAQYPGTCSDLCEKALKNGNLGMQQGFGYGKARVDCKQWIPRGIPMHGN